MTKRFRVSASVAILAVLLAGGGYYGFKTAKLEALLSPRGEGGTLQWSIGEKWYSPRLETNEKRFLTADAFLVNSKQDLRLQLKQTSANGRGEDVRVQYWLANLEGDQMTEKVEVNGHTSNEIVFQKVVRGSYKVVAQTVGVLDSIGSGEVKL